MPHKVQADLASLHRACNCMIAPAPRITSASLQAYVLKRLVRGLGSGRQGARQGFALALAALLGARPSLSPASVLELMDQHLPFSKEHAGARPASYALKH